MMQVIMFAGSPQGHILEEKNENYFCVKYEKNPKKQTQDGRCIIAYDDVTIEVNKEQYQLQKGDALILVDVLASSFWDLNDTVLIHELCHWGSNMGECDEWVWVLWDLFPKRYSWNYRDRKVVVEECDSYAEPRDEIDRLLYLIQQPYL